LSDQLREVLNDPTAKPVTAARPFAAMLLKGRLRPSLFDLTNLKFLRWLDDGRHSLAIVPRLIAKRRAGR